MKSTALWINHFLHVDTPTSKKAGTTQQNHVFQRLGAWLGQYLCDAGEPKVWKTLNGSGSTTWHVHDPIANEYAEFDTEMDTRIWLEKRYNQPAGEVVLHVQR